MAFLTRVDDFQSGTPIESAVVDAELNQFIGLLDGSDNVDIKILGKTFNIPKQIVVNSDIVGTDANTTEKDLATYTIPAGTLIATNDWIQHFSRYEIASDANNKTIRGYFNGNLVFTAGPSGGAGYTHAEVTMKAIRLSATSVRVIFTYGQYGIGVFWEVTTPVAAGNLDSTTNIFKVTGQNAVATANQIQKIYHEYHVMNNL